jgi:Fe-S-cluster-containing dehydrogenase component
MAKRYGLAIDLERCIGCHTCTIACKLENGIEKGSWIKVQTIGGPHPDTPSGRHPELHMHFLPVLCMHCDQPPCVDACPLQAISKREDGIVLIEEGKCDGCQACLPACPYQALMYDEEKNTVRKCTLCAHRVDEGLEPFCLVCCETEAMYAGDLEDPDSPVAQIVSRRNAEVLHAEKGMGPAVYFCPTRHGRIL